MTIPDIVYRAHRNAWRENSTVSAGNDGISQFKDRMAGHILDKGIYGRAASPFEKAEIIALFDLAADTALRIQYRNDHGIMSRCLIYNPNHSVSADHPHLTINAVGFSSIDGEVIVYSDRKSVV